MTSSSGGPRQVRSLLYEWLSSAFFIPTTDTAVSTFVKAGGELQAMLSPDAPVNDVDFRLSLDATRSNSDIRLQQLKLEYSRLFLGPPTGIIHPYESIYRGEDYLMTQQALDVAAFYRNHGIEFDPAGFREPPDHIAVELEFLAMVCAGEVQTGEAADVEWTFIRDHLGQWGLRFAHDVQAATQDPLYRMGASLLAAVLTHVEEGYAATTD